jgi:hypothetical protein
MTPSSPARTIGEGEDKDKNAAISGHDKILAPQLTRQK